MKKNNVHLLNLYENEIFIELCSLESVLKLTKESCLKHEECSNYYNLQSKYKLKLSDERNHYLNMLNISLEKIIVLKKICSNLEERLLFLKENSDYSR